MNKWIRKLSLPAWSTRLSSQELRILVIFMAMLVGVWLFMAIADEVVEGETGAIDEWILQALRNPDDLTDPLGPPWFEEAILDSTALGSAALLVLFSLSVVGYLLLRRQYRLATLVVLTVSGGMLINLLLKENFARPRPELVPHGVAVIHSSFPSGHSMGAAATYLTLGALLARTQKRRRLRAYCLLQAILLTAVVGFSRIYLGVHWPSDVLAGWIAGATWALLCWLIAFWLEQRSEAALAQE